MLKITLFPRFYVIELKIGYSSSKVSKWSDDGKDFVAINVPLINEAIIICPIKE